MLAEPVRVIAGPFGPVTVDTTLPWKYCRGRWNGRSRLPCKVRVPAGKPGGKCYGCEHKDQSHTRLRPVRVDPELGLVRYCQSCDEWWPDDSEFWYAEERNGRSFLHCRAHRGRQSALLLRGRKTVHK